jgi:peptidyl-prolyl cis-trans isomerase B (cyclophilin B)
MGIVKTEKDWIAMKRLAIAIVAALFTSLFAAPNYAVANTQRPKAVTAKSESVKTEKVRCKNTKAAAANPARIAPPENILKRGPRTITLQTNCGNIVIQTFFKQAPVTITVLSSLIRGGYYNRTLCHRLTTEGIYVLQCGDPTATGSGGPEFRYRDENLPVAGTNNYPAGVVAMANSGPNTNGSQFFLVYKDTTLGPNYTIWGRITSGLEIVRHIAEGGVKKGEADGVPMRTIAIERATSN